MNNITDKLNRPIRDLRISVMDTCNFRCPYCMPIDKFDDNYKFLSPSARLSFQEIEKVVKVFAGYGVNKIRITGGEPLLRKNLADLITTIKSIAGIEDIALTTNGQLLKQQLSQLINAGLDRVNISLDTLNPDLYYQMSGNKGQLYTALDAVEAAYNSSLKSVKLNCVVQKGINDKEIIPLLAKFQNTNIIVRFIEFMDVGNKNDWHQNNVLAFTDIIKIIEQKWGILPVDPNYVGEVATRYKYIEHQGEIGFITSISKPFCRDCSRARLSADGKLYTCLFTNQEHDLRKCIRNENDDALQQMIKNIWQNRDDRYSELRTNHDDDEKDKQDKIEMYVIGG
ncbi:MAG: GTP 3',8-cyclase MoaA [Proteobacteria bacterium]|nr:GTP 3',8-cyclase MoaA [Pseudomonadota bacterium]